MGPYEDLLIKVKTPPHYGQEISPLRSTYLLTTVKKTPHHGQEAQEEMAQTRRTTIWSCIDHPVWYSERRGRRGGRATGREDDIKD